MSDHVAHDAPNTQPPAAEATYAGREARWSAEVQALSGRWNALSNGRLVAFALGAVALFWAAVTFSPVALVVGVAGMVAFVVLIRLHQRLGRVRGRALTLAAINREGIARVRRDWAAIPLADDQPADPAHRYAADLDIIGHASLLHLLDTTTSTGGRTTLRAWLLDPADLATIRARQAAVAELAPRLDDRQELAQLGRRRKPAGSPDLLLAWAEGTGTLARRPWLPWLARVLAVLFVAAVLADATGLVDLPLWVPLLVINLAVSALLGGAAGDVISRAASQQGALQRYGEQLAAISAWDVSSPALVALQGRIAASGVPAADALRRLDRILAWSIPRGSIPWVPAQATVLWDIHLLAALEGWQARNGRHVREWLAALGEAEAMAALAGLAGDNPDWAMPAVDPVADAFTGERLGHPLIAATQRVDNDVTVGPPGSFLLVTGSNMSGKSTLLRSVGVNAVLASAGGPVCAAALRMPPVDLWTSVRVTDSLAAGVSFFMAELLRLRSVTDAATAHAAVPGGRRFLYLLDEILQGTNSRERRIAARRIVGHLVATGAIGAVTTHDLDLAETPSLARSTVPVHFREHVAEGPDGAVMRFDHLMRPGIATSTNALALMAAIGLDLPDPDDA